MPFYSQHQTNLINNNYLYFENHDKNKNNNPENNKIKNQNLFQNNQAKDHSFIPIPQKEKFSELEEDEPKPVNSQKSGQVTTKFFTDYGGYGYKCSCSKTQCNRYYCECYRSGLYCIDCNCKNCENKLPENYVSNRHPIKETTQSKHELVTCTCTKSGCNKKYCECYKNGTKCNSACRCVGCENSENALNVKKNGEKYECCPANSIYIFKNKIYEEIILENYNQKEKYKGKTLEKKRKRNDNEDRNEF